MAKSKNLFFKLSQPLLPLFNLQALAASASSHPAALVYHTISDDTPAHLRHLYTVRTISEFEDDLENLLKHFQPIDLHQLIQVRESKEKLIKPALHITFDDGLSEFYNHAAPLLLKKGIPASCFLNNSFIDNKNLMFRLKASLLIEHLRKQESGSQVWKDYHAWLKEQEVEDVYYRKFLLGIRFENSHLLDELAVALEYDFKQYLQKHQPYLSTDQIHELRDKGFTFGAHSSEHPYFNALSEENQIKEIRESVADICKGFDLDYKSFAFPFTDDGISLNVFMTLQQKNICDITFGCAGIKTDSAKISMQRFPVESYYGSIDKMLKKEYLYQLFLSRIGKAVVNR